MISNKATIIIKDEVNIRIRGLDQEAVSRLQDRLTFFVPGYIHMPSYKLGRWDGQIRLFSKTGTCYLNLLEDYILPIILDIGYEVDIEDHRGDYSHIADKLTTISEDYLGDQELGGKPVKIRDYQVEGINIALTTGSGILEMATGAGKTIVCATLSKIYAVHGRVVVIVPNIDLVVQTQHTFKQIGIDAGIWYGTVKDRKQVTIATWQSIDHFPELFHGVTCVIVDEVHQAKAKVLNEILTGPAGHVPFRFGCTGTIPKEELYKLQIFSCIGTPIFQLRTWELQERGVLADTMIYQLELADSSNPHYIQRVDKFPFEDWNDELTWLFSSKERMQYIADLIIDTVCAENGNTLVLVPHRKHGKELQKLMGGSWSLDGRDKKRGEVYKAFNEGDDQVLICTYGIASTGIDIPRIFNQVMLEPGKKFERVNQTLGRGLRKADDKHSLAVYDIYSDSGISSTHGTKRRSLFREAKQKLEVIKVEYYDDTDA